MKKFDYFKSTIDCYKEANYSNEAMSHLYYLESRCERLGEYLNEYRYIQPDENLFSERSLKIISELHALEHMLYEQKNLINGFGKQLEHLMGIIFNAKHKQYEEPHYDIDSIDDSIF